MTNGNGAREAQDVHADDAPVGLVLGTAAEASTPLAFSVYVDPDQYLQLDDVVHLRSPLTSGPLAGRETIDVYGVVDELRAVQEGVTFDSDVRLASDGVLPAAVADVVPEQLRGTGLALVGTGQALARFCCSLAFGAAWWIARRQAQSQVIATIYFDRFKWTRRLMGERLARRIQQRYTTAEILRLIDPDSGEHVRVYINPPETANMSPDELEAWRDQRRDASGRPYILRSVEALKYDVTISDTPSTPTARATALLALLEVVGKMPSILPAVVDEILSLADIPDKPKILRRVRALMAAQGIDVDGSGAAPPSGPGGPPQPGGGAPPPGGPPPGGPPPPGMPPGGPPLPGTPTIPGQTPSAAPPPPPPAQIPQGMPVAPGGPLAPIPGVRRSSGARRLRNQMPGGQTQVLG